jgi:hypothetical protein
MSFVNEKSTNSSWARVEVFVAAPGGSIDIPVVEIQRNVPHSMSEIPYDKDAQISSEVGNGRNIKELASVELNARQ